MAYSPNKLLEIQQLKKAFNVDAIHSEYGMTRIKIQQLVLTFEKNSEVIELFQKMPSPLAIYIMSSNKKNIKFFMENTVSGGVSINKLMMTVVNPNLPFGGVNNSGIGKSGGKHSFVDFSNEKGVVKKKFGNMLKLVYPPFNQNIFKYFKTIAKI